MKPAPFACHAPNTVADAVLLLADLEMPKLPAGGQSLMPMRNMRYVFTDNLIDLNRIECLEDVHTSADYRRTVAATLVRRSLVEAAGRAARRR